MMVQKRKYLFSELKLLKKGPKNQIGGEHTDAVVDILMARIVPFMKKITEII